MGLCLPLLPLSNVLLAKQDSSVNNVLRTLSCTQVTCYWLEIWGDSFEFSACPWFPPGSWTLAPSLGKP